MSKYTVLPFNFRYIESLDKVLLTTLTGSFTFIDNSSVLHSIIRNDIDTIEIPIVDDLLSNNILSETNELDSKINIMTSNYASTINSTIYDGPLLVLVVPTLRCDHDCGYCQVSRVSSEAIGYDYEVESITKTIQYLKKLKVSSIKIEFQGGEPLLNKDFIREFYDQAIHELGSKTSFVICSAFGPLDFDFIQWVKDKNITFSTSVDGAEDIHTSNRSSKYFNSYTQTEQGIRLIQSELGKDKVNALATVTKKSLVNPRSIIDTYIALGFDSIFLRPLSPLGFAYKNQGIEYTPEEYMSFYRESMEYIFSINKTKYFREETAVIYLQKMLFTTSSGYVDLQSPSAILLNSLVINYDGNIFGSDESRMLWEMTKNRELIFDNIHNTENKIISPIEINLLSDTFISSTPGCDECAYQPYCGADPLYHLATQGDHVGNKAISDYCKLQRYLFDYFFELLNDTSRKEILLKWLK
ncbi:MAG: His-Xaa-Ser system radical SAM maturase HxsB [Sulfurovum sp.]|nr:His-Xaa-Ser system radical SAM maturase HxsB [Sulfurovum sp.]MCB4764135.1 His-Xaa-Ser system radical SAM maturase HxsB [Sulfurovum sp.]MCB4766510.1 His-Xaa-Ser system radical SAM maturase HxsB [Sulfurovum sp.]MCB4773277.1 His-Xaa-Ser system radical SAM maturase HxsB [Sulfurovum sp.]MCB4774003.1 His-Xaa-Ser system radical SAM maturase HxsB [Sulfurovum sp.]